MSNVGVCVLIDGHDKAQGTFTALPMAAQSHTTPHAKAGQTQITLFGHGNVFLGDWMNPQRKCV